MADAVESRRIVTHFGNIALSSVSFTTDISRRGEDNVNLQMIKQCLCLCFLYQLARQDYRWKRMDAGLLYGFLAAGIVCFALEFFSDKEKVNTSTTVFLLLLSILPGVLFLVTGALTHEAVGYGDGLSILAMGFYVEAYVLWRAVGISLVFVMFYIPVQGLVQKHRYEKEQKHKQEQRQEYKQEQESEQVQRSGTVPFLPFLLAGTVVMSGVS